MLALDAVLTGAKGVNLWSSFRNPPQRSARLYRALVDKGLASSVFGALLPTEDPFLYTVAVTAADGVPLDAVEEAAVAVLEEVRARGITPAELQRAKHQLRARLVFESDSGTNIAHQLGYFHTIGDVGMYHHMWDSIAGVTLESVARAAASCLRATNRTVGLFKPIGTAGSVEAE